MTRLWETVRGTDPKNGVALTSLAGDFQEQLRSYLENAAGDNLLATLRVARMDQIMAGTLKITPPTYLIRNAEGKYVPDLANGMLLARITSPGQDRLEWQLLAPENPRQTLPAAVAQPDKAP